MEGEMTLPDAKAQLLEQFARVGKTLSSPARIELLDLLAQGEKSVETLAGQAGLSVTNTSNHLKTLRSAGLILSRRDGQFVHYRLADPSVLSLLRSLQEVARRQLAEAREIVRQYFEEPHALEPVSAPELLARMRAGEVIVLDVRPEDEYAAGHIPGAISVPVAELERRLAAIPHDKELVAYCRGPHCVLAVRAVSILRARGYHARRLEEGLPDWRARGHEVAVGKEAGTMPGQESP
jgi:ArsR family transcriptional regulator